MVIRRTQLKEMKEECLMAARSFAQLYDRCKSNNFYIEHLNSEEYELDANVIINILMQIARQIWISISLRPASRELPAISLFALSLCLQANHSTNKILTGFVSRKL